MNIYDNQYIVLREKKLLEILGKTKTITEVCKELEVSRPSVYMWLARYKRFGVEGVTT